MISEYERNKNCLTLIRIIAAFQVMLGHIVEHLELPISDTLRSACYFFRGVPIFFAISGMLIWFSINNRSKSYSHYLKKRFLRIYPELWVAVVVNAVVIIVLYEHVILKDLFLLCLGQGTIVQFWTPDSLRGYGVGTPNGALWTIGVMIQFYVVAWPISKVLRGKDEKKWALVFAISFIASIAVETILSSISTNEIIIKLYEQTIIRYFWLFFIGMFIAEFWGKYIPLLARYWYVSVVVAVAFFTTGIDCYAGYYLFWSLFLICGCIGFAYRFNNIHLSTDFSYGLFLYHMIVVNVFVHFKMTGNWEYAVAVMLISILLAYVSTITIGKWSANIKGSLKA